jgi:hypothetical protein
MKQNLIEEMEVVPNFWWLVENMAAPESVGLVSHSLREFGPAKVEVLSLAVDYTHDGVDNPEFFVTFSSVDIFDIHQEAIQCTGVMLSAGESWIF